MKKHVLIIGISGSFGAAMAKALLNQGYEVSALVRDPQKVPQTIKPLQVIVGSCTDEASLNQATQNVDWVVYAANPPYHRWPELAESMLEPVVQVCEKKQLHLLFPGNIYNFSYSPTAIVEGAQQQAPSEKGQIRIRMEQRLQQAAQQGATITLVRAGDFLGEHAKTSWMTQLLRKKSNKLSFSLPHDDQHRHYWSYLPDLVNNSIAVAELAQPGLNIWHDPGLLLQKRDWQQAFKTLGYNIEIKKMAWWPLYMIRYFTPMIAEIIKMRYLWQQDFIFDGSKMSQALGDRLQRTELSEVLKVLLR